jgi:hypothetical protein
MPEIMARYLLLLMLVSSTIFWHACSYHRAGPSKAASSPDPCGPELTDAQVTGIAKRALRVMWGHEPLLDHYRVSIQAQGCDYVFIAGQLGPEMREDIVILVDRTGRVKTFPVCCDLGDCPEYCKPAVSGMP